MKKRRKKQALPAVRKQVAFTIDPKVYNKVTKKCDKLGLSFAGLNRELLSTWLKDGFKNFKKDLTNV